MIEFHSKSDFLLEDKTLYSDWIDRVIHSEGCHVGNLDFVFCHDEYLLGINKEYLDHDTLTDIITFDYTEDKTISGDIFISSDRVRENALEYGVDFQNELLRVMSHGVLHLMGYGDKKEHEIRIMRGKEEEKIKMFHVEQ